MRNILALDATAVLSQRPQFKSFDPAGHYLWGLAVQFRKLGVCQPLSVYLSTNTNTCWVDGRLPTQCSVLSFYHHQHDNVISDVLLFADHQHVCWFMSAGSVALLLSVTMSTFRLLSDWHPATVLPWQLHPGRRLPVAQWPRAVPLRSHLCAASPADATF